MSDVPHSPGGVENHAVARGPALCAAGVHQDRTRISDMRLARTGGEAACGSPMIVGLPRQGRSKPAARCVVSERTWLLGICALSTALGLIYAVAIRPGSGYDEPVHYSNVQFYAHHARMPILGVDATGYEAQMGPVYYALAAIVARVAGPAGVQPAFYAVRFAGLGLLILAVILTRLIVMELVPRRPRAWVVPALLVGCNPIILAVAASVQNDMLTIVLSTLTVLLLLRWVIPGGLDTRRALILGALVSIAVLSKLTAVFLIASVPLTVALVDRRALLRFIPPFAGAIVLLTGWWWLRNFRLYHDVTSLAAARHFYGAAFAPPVELWHPHVFGGWLYKMVAYYWFPAEYYRNLFHVPSLLRVAVGVITIVGMVGIGLAIWRPCRWALWRRERGGAILFVHYAVCLAMYVYGSVRVNEGPARHMFGAFVVFAVVIGLGCHLVVVRRWPFSANYVALGAGGFLLGCSGFVLLRMHQAPVLPYNLFL